ncbi:hypothetical protein B0J17DRAFT_723440 [Rhizoctonia solani]|nr:hypothetical protein B0J17DRAFT_723440 [Rhizoctonia solani]
MPSLSTRSGSKSSNRVPFTVDSIKQYEPFQELEPQIQAKLCKLLASGVHRFAEMAKHHMGELNSNLKHRPSVVKSEWNNSRVERAEYSALVERAQRKHNAKFPGYKYTPIPDRKWETINEDGRRKWFFEFLSLVSTNMVHGCTGARPGSLDIDEWIQDPMNRKYVSNEVLDEVVRRARLTASTSRNPRGLSPIQMYTHFELLCSWGIFLKERALAIYNQNIPCEHENVALSPFPETLIYSYPQLPHPARGAYHSDARKTGSASGEQTPYSEFPISNVTKESYGTSQGNPSNAQLIPAVHYRLNNIHDLADTMGMTEGLGYLTCYDLPLTSGEFVPDGEQVLWDVNDMEGYNPHLARGSYDIGQTATHDQLVVTGSETVIDNMPMSRLSDQGGAFTGSNAEHLYDDSVLMNEFLNPFVLEDMDVSGSRVKAGFSDAF